MPEQTSVPCSACGELVPSPQFRSEQDGAAGWFPDADYPEGICSMCGHHHGHFLPVKKESTEVVQGKDGSETPLVRIYDADFIP